MDFIERCFGVVPDGGDGSLELLYVGVAAIAATGSLFWRRISRGLRGAIRRTS
jgi:hypothetical protein